MTVSASVRRHLRATYQTSPVVYQIMKWVFTRIMHIVYDYRATGQENFPPSGPTIIAVNHLHLFDPGAVMPAVPRKIVTLAADKWERNWVLGTLLRLAGVIFVRRGEVDRVALRDCLSVLSEGGVLAVAPEGTRSRTAALQRAKAGIAYLATRTNAVVVPVAFWGVERIGDWKRLKRPTCNVVVGRPFRLPQIKGKPSTEELQQMADLIMIRTGMLLPPSYRGVYAERIAAIESGQSNELAALS
jgi:1-acyl-sn-glycerol-3-phosphate acyltransferase